MNNRAKSLIFGLFLSLLVACSDDGSGTGQMSLQLAEALVDLDSEVTKVMVEFSGVELYQDRTTPQRFLFEAPRQIDLLDLPGDDSTVLLNRVTLPAGRYGQVRLLVHAGLEASDSYIELSDGSVHPLFIPKSNRSGLNVNKSFSIPEDGYARFAIDFDLRKSVTNPKGLGSAYILRPSLRLLESGALEGSELAM